MAAERLPSHRRLDFRRHLHGRGGSAIGDLNSRIGKVELKFSVTAGDNVQSTAVCNPALRCTVAGPRRTKGAIPRACPTIYRGRSGGTRRSQIRPDANYALVPVAVTVAVFATLYFHKNYHGTRVLTRRSFVRLHAGRLPSIETSSARVRFGTIRRACGAASFNATVWVITVAVSLGSHPKVKGHVGNKKTRRSGFLSQANALAATAPQRSDTSES